LIAVSKTKPLEDVRLARIAGQLDFGENRVQEALAKIETSVADSPDLRWHLIGPLQKNKAKHCIDRFHRIHTVASIALAETLQHRLEMADSTQKILIQLNLSGEETKAGLDEAGAAALLAALKPLDRLDPVGLMTIPPPVREPEQARPGFRALREVRDRLAVRSGLPLEELSMGMSGDFEVAIEEGATWIRVGTSIFGNRVN
jgi:pyridoxal phosphate enzyme (YggS family)